MTIYLKESADKDKLKNNLIHYMPCKIHYDGEAKISRYFTYDKAGGEKEAELKASFRGYPLSGKEVPVPEGYKGRIFKESTSSYFDNMPRHLKSAHAFDSMVFWNWDQPPSRADPFISALDWIHIAKAVHENPEED